MTSDPADATGAAQSVALPDGLVLIDGHCVLCAGSFSFVARRDPAVRFVFAPLQGAYGRSAAAALGIDPEDPESFAVVAGGRALVKSDGALHVLSRLRGWGWIRVLQAIPRPARDWLYDRVARNRYRLFGRRDMCMLPDAALARHMVRD